jgi:hypothetical protein
MLLVALGASACSYDLDILRGRDASVDTPAESAAPDRPAPDVPPPDAAPLDAATDVARPDAAGMDADAPAIDAPTMDVARPDVTPDNPSVDVSPADVVADLTRPDVAPDLPSPDVAPDVAPDAATREPVIGLCSLTGVERVTPGPQGVTVIEGTTVGALPNALTMACTSGISTASTRIYRYEVQSGSRLVASTNTGRCNTHDTVLAAYFSCESGGRPVGSALTSCNDDDRNNLCGACSGGPGVSNGCGIVLSTLTLDNLVPRDVIYFAVANYAGVGATSPGPFRLTIAENGLRPIPTPGRTEPIPGAPQCLCPSAPTPPFSNGMVSFPSSFDSGSLASGTRTLVGTRPAPLARAVGVSARLALSRFSVNTSGACAVPGDEPRAALDLVVGTSVVATVSLSASVARSGFVTIPYVAFALMSLTPGADLALQYRIRPVAPLDPSCFSLDVDPAGGSTVTLYGTN